ncbi:hypothetical protein COCOBI_01-8040 [Coccomyxa sp. Obi]|nr:hypothetical protein COCOBI_01-8040 [Coccomyxa sp. Obi]
MLGKREAFLARTASIGVNKGIGSSIKKRFHRPQNLQLRLDKVLSDLQFQASKTETRTKLQRVAMQERTCLETQQLTRLAQQEAAMYQETQRLKDVADFAYTLIRKTDVNGNAGVVNHAGSGKHHSQSH